MKKNKFNAKDIKGRDIKKIFEQQNNHMIIGLTGQYGSGCTTVSTIMSNKYEDLGIERPKQGEAYLPTSETDKIRDKVIINRYSKQKWEPFDRIRTRDVINTFILEFCYNQNNNDYTSVFIELLRLFDVKYKTDAENTNDENAKHIDKIIEEFNNDFRRHLQEIYISEVNKIPNRDDNKTSFSLRGEGNDKVLATFSKNYKPEYIDKDDIEPRPEDAKYLYDDLIHPDSSICIFETVCNLNILFIEEYNAKKNKKNKKGIINQESENNKIIEEVFKKYFEDYRPDPKWKIIRELCYFYIKYVLPAFSLATKELLDPFKTIYNDFANKIRCFGEIKKEFEPIHEMTTKPMFFSIARRMTRFIKAYRHPTERVSDDIPVRVVIDAIKNPFEGYYLQQRYSSFYLVAILKDDEKRKKSLKDSGRNDSEAMDLNERPSLTRKLFKNFKDDKKIKLLTGSQKEYFEDERCSDFRDYIFNNELQNFYLQDVEACIQNADIFITNNEDSASKSKLKYSILKYVSLIMHPGLVLPTEIERCMQIAFTAKVNSGCISRQVGAVVTDTKFNILSVGWNDVPCGETSCARRNIKDMYLSHDEGAYSDYEIEKNSEFRKHVNDNYIINSLEFLKGIPAAYCFKDIYQDLKNEKNQVHTRAMHGEERALLSCSVQQTTNGNLFTTSSPCELCAKKAKHYRIKNIFYIEPYPGISQSHICNVGDHDNRAEYRLFEGAIGTAYQKLYTPVMPLKDELNLRGLWEKIEKPKVQKEVKVDKEEKEHE